MKTFLFLVSKCFDCILQRVANGFIFLSGFQMLSFFYVVMSQYWTTIFLETVGETDIVNLFWRRLFSLCYKVYPFFDRCYFVPHQISNSSSIISKLNPPTLMEFRRRFPKITKWWNTTLLYFPISEKGPNVFENSILIISHQ